MPRNLLKEMIPIMNPDDDFMTIVAAEQKIAASWAKRKKEIEQSEAHLNGTLGFISYILKHNRRVLQPSRKPLNKPKYLQRVQHPSRHKSTTSQPSTSWKKNGFKLSS